mmetsp:Transcript_6276/g.14395  ORF Transcript_6276/g.14395 Transcript_6276/m.14395 type:complete len:363 (-) Transcript_6276:63-1151(-)
MGDDGGSVDIGYVAGGMKDVNLFLDRMLWPLFVGWFGLLMVSLMVLQFHVLPPKKSSTPLRLIGRTGLVLQVYYSGIFPAFISRAPFWSSMMVVFLDTVVLFYLTSRHGFPIKDMVKEWLREEQELGILNEQFLTQEVQGLQCTVDLKPINNCYMCVTNRFRRPALTFIAQVGLMSYYVWNLNADPDSHDKSKVSIMKWLFAVIITLVVGEDETGSDFNDRFWQRLLGDKGFWTEERKTELCTMWFGFVPVTYWAEWQIRSALDRIVNSVFRAVLLSTAPIMLSPEEPLDFIKDCLAIFFIAKLDDFDDAKEPAFMTREAMLTNMPEELTSFVLAKVNQLSAYDAGNSPGREADQFRIRDTA